MVSIKTYFFEDMKDVLRANLFVGDMLQLIY